MKQIIFIIIIIILCNTFVSLSQETIPSTNDLTVDFVKNLGANTIFKFTQSCAARYCNGATIFYLKTKPTFIPKYFFNF